MKNKYKLIILLTILLIILSCSVKLVSDYDRDTAYKIVEISKMVDLFYMNIFETDSLERNYDKFAEDYKLIEVELRALLMMNKIRPLNEESTEIAESILELWLKYKDAHKERDTYKDAQIKLHQKRFNRNFIAMATGEAVKADDE